MPVNLELEQLRGRYGKTLSALRPAGVTDFDGRRVDTMSEGTLIEAGQWVRCIDVQGRARSSSARSTARRTWPTWRRLNFTVSLER